MSSPRAALRILTAVSFTCAFDRVLIAPLLLSVARDFDIGLASASLLATVHFFTFGFMQLVWAAVSDRLGRVRALRLSLVLAAVAGLLASVSPTFALLLAARAAAGATYAAGVPGALTYIGDTVPVHRRQGPLTDLMRGTALGTVGGIVGGGLLVQLVSWRVAFLSIAVVAFVLALVMSRLPEPSEHRSARPFADLAGVLRNRGAVLVMALGAGEGCAVLACLNFLPAALKEQSGVGAAVAGAAVSGYGLAILAATPVVKRLAGRATPSMIIGLGAAPTVAGLLMFVWRIDVPSIFAGSALLGVGWALIHSTLQTWATEIAPAARATAVSLFAASLFTGSAVGSGVGGSVLSAGGYVEVFTVFLGLGAVLVLSAYLARRRTS